MAGSAVASKGPHVGSPSPRSLHPLQPHTVLPCIQCLQRAMPRILTISHCDLCPDFAKGDGVERSEDENFKVP